MSWTCGFDRFLPYHLCFDLSSWLGLRLRVVVFLSGPRNKWVGIRFNSPDNNLWTNLRRIDGVPAGTSGNWTRWLCPLRHRSRLIGGGSGDMCASIVDRDRSFTLGVYLAAMSLWHWLASIFLPRRYLDLIVIFYFRLGVACRRAGSFAPILKDRAWDMRDIVTSALSSIKIGNIAHMDISLGHISFVLNRSRHLVDSTIGRSLMDWRRGLYWWSLRFVERDELRV